MSLQSFENLLSKTVGANKKIIHSDITNLVAAGENFGGELLKLTITVENQITKETEVLHAVAKKIPEMELFQKIFNIQETFKSEIIFYEKLVPIFRQFQEQHKIKNVLNCFAELYGSRLNLNGSDIVDRDAVIILEDLIVSGYKNLDRYIGYDMEEAKLALKELAVLHSVPLGIKMKKPDLFQKDIRPHLEEKFKPQQGILDTLMFISEILFESDKCAAAVTKVQKVWKLFTNNPDSYKPREPFATLSHSDLWVNNIMIKHDKGKPIHIKFVDFQVYNYKSPVMDLLNFLFTSVRNEVLKENIDDLIRFYHKELIENLKQLECDTEDYRFSEFQKELQEDASKVLCWALNFIPFIIFGPKGKVGASPHGDFDINSNKIRDEMRKATPYIAKEKMQFIVEYCESKKWI
ncbi:uncharacterized protein LOC130891329 [Diorhabda carinulata]|uniref:uncharacterized protein LOC130891329 n=1 Tax=Diorhabda carinulata TaxID=1163345 RepID=UPI0025A0A382|nr:uncharacterized protein LOC130891329 [Diorhabda carinulata]